MGLPPRFDPWYNLLTLYAESEFEGSGTPSRSHMGEKIPMGNQSPPSSPEVLIPYGKSRFRVLSILVGLIALLAGLIALLVVSYEPQTPTQYEKTTKTVENASKPEQKPVQSDTQSIVPEQKSTQSNIRSARTDTKLPLQPTKNDVETKMCQVADRDFFHRTGITVSRGQNNVPDSELHSEQVAIDDKLTAEEVFAAAEKDPSVQIELDVPISGIRFYDGAHVTSTPRHPDDNAQKLSQTERVRLCGLRRIQRMAALTLYNNRCGDRPRDDKAAAAAIIESQFEKLPGYVQKKTLDSQVKAIEAHRGTLHDPGGWRRFCDRVHDDIEKGNADYMFKTAREGFFPIEEN